MTARAHLRHTLATPAYRAGKALQDDPSGFGGFEAEQANLLRRLAGAPIRGENYNRADIQPGRVGPEQTPPRREFD